MKKNKTKELEQVPRKFQASIEDQVILSNMVELVDIDFKTIDHQNNMFNFLFNSDTNPTDLIMLCSRYDDLCESATLKPIDMVHTRFYEMYSDEFKGLQSYKTSRLRGVDTEKLIDNSEEV